MRGYLPRMRRLLIAAGILASAGCGASAHDDAPLVPATLVGEPAIPYPPDLFGRRIEGTVMLYLVVDSTGAVIRDSTRIAHGSGQAAFDSAALLAAPTLRFHPARRDSVAVTAAIQVPIRFTLPDSLRNGKGPR